MRFKGSGIGGIGPMVAGGSEVGLGFPMSHTNLVTASLPHPSLPFCPPGPEVPPLWEI